jgi:hypothetical protein
MRGQLLGTLLCMRCGMSCLSMAGVGWGERQVQQGEGKLTDGGAKSDMLVNVLQCDLLCEMR